MRGTETRPIPRSAPRPASRPALYQRHWPAADEPAAGTLLFVHGLSEHSGRYAELAAAAGAVGFAAAAVDLFGHGKSPGRRGHIRDFDADHLGAVDELIRHVERDAPETPVLLVGHSLGGLIAARWAQTRVFAARLRGLILISPFVEPRMRIPGWKRAAARLFASFAPAFSVPTGIADEDVFRDPAERRRFAADPLVQRRISAGHWTALERERDRLRETAEALATPTLLLLAGEDRIVSTAAARTFAGSLRDSTVIEYAEAFHALHYDPLTPDVIRDLLAWAGARTSA